MPKSHPVHDIQHNDSHYSILCFQIPYELSCGSKSRQIQMADNGLGKDTGVSPKEHTDALTQQSQRLTFYLMDIFAQVGDGSRRSLQNCPDKIIY